VRVQIAGQPQRLFQRGGRLVEAPALGQRVGVRAEGEGQRPALADRAQDRRRLGQVAHHAFRVAVVLLDLGAERQQHPVGPRVGVRARHVDRRETARRVVGEEREHRLQQRDVRAPGVAGGVHGGDQLGDPLLGRQAFTGEDHHQQPYGHHDRPLAR
jgi:hypothetical protein